MAQRKKPQTSAVKDSSEADNSDLTSHLLDQGDFDRYVKMTFLGSTNSVQQLKETALIHLGRIGVKPNASKAVSVCPQEASNNTNLQSLFVWMSSLDKGHKRAVAQLVALHASACRRLGV